MAGIEIEIEIARNPGKQGLRAIFSKIIRRS